MPHPTIQRLLVASFALLCAAPAAAAPDLGVRCISRSPLYWRYNVVYPGGVPTLAPTHGRRNPAKDQHWPTAGKTVTFTAHVRNHGDTAVAGFGYRWYVDGVRRGTSDGRYTKALAPGAEALVPLTWTWPADLADHTLKLIVDPDDQLGDTLRPNNAYEDFTNALSFSIWVEQGLYDRFDARTNGFGTRSFDDWFRWQLDAMKQDFARSIYPDVAPAGILERVRVEEIRVIPFDPRDLDNWRKVMAADPHLYLNDGRWQFVSEAPTLAGKQHDWDDYVERFVGRIDWGLVHELSHQLGVIDEYRLNVDLPSQNRVSAMRHDFHLPGLMGGGYVAAGYDASAYDSHTAGYLNRNLHRRRGFYGDYLFDTPSVTRLLLTGSDGAPVAGAKVTLYQKDVATETLEPAPVFTGQTDAAGVVTLPNRGVRGTTTATGHTLRPNPFGQIDVVGRNGVMLVEVEQRGERDYRWLEIIQLNEALWRGVQALTVPIRTTLQSRGIAPTNLALHRPATASSDAAHASGATDGDTAGATSPWIPSPPVVGSWWQVDLGASHEVARVVVHPSARNAHDWFSAFRLEVSSTGAFAGEQQLVWREGRWDETRARGDHGLQRLTGLADRCVYTFPPRSGRYVRVTAEVEQSWVQLQELEVFAAKP
jgi:hypothetical protein